MGRLIKYVALGDTTNLPRWLNPDHYEGFALGAGNGKLWGVAIRPASEATIEGVPDAVFMVPPDPADQAGFQPWTWFGEQLDAL